MFDVDPKWAELVKERGNLPHDLQKRLSGNERSSVNKGKSPGRPPMMPSPTSQQSQSTANLATSMASGLNFPLGSLNSSLLSGLSLGNFDPKNPLLMPFGGLTNLGALGGLGNLGNLGNMGLPNSLFANLAGLNLPSLAGMEAALNAQVASNSAAAAAAAAAAADANNPVVSSAGTVSSGKNAGAGSSSNMSGSGGSGGGGGSSKSRSSKLDQPTTSKSSASGPSTLSAVSSASLPTPSPFPFLFTNPSLLYTPLTLSGLNPFSIQSGGVSSAYESLAQCGLLNPPTSTASTVRKSTSSNSSRQREIAPESSTSSSSSSSSTTKRKEPEKKSSRYPVDPAVTLQQYTDMAALHGGEERRRVEQQQQQQQTQQQHEKRETAITEQADVVAADLSEKKTERKSKEQEMKEALEHLSRTSAELVTRNIDDAPRSEKPPSRNRSSTDSNQNSEQQQQQQRSTPSAPPPLEVTLEPVTKKMRTEMDTNTKSSASNNEVPTVEIETVMRPSPTTPTKATQQPASLQEETSSIPPVEANTVKKEVNEMTTSLTSSSSANATSPSTQNVDAKNDGGKSTAPEAEEDGKSGTKAPKKARSGKRLSVEPPPERKNLRSSAGRQARAAAERQARMEGEMQQSEQQQQQQQQDSHVAGE